MQVHPNTKMSNTEVFHALLRAPISWGSFYCSYTIIFIERIFRNIGIYFIIRNTYPQLWIKLAQFTHDNSSFPTYTRRTHTPPPFWGRSSSRSRYLTASNGSAPLPPPPPPAPSALAPGSPHEVFFFPTRLLVCSTSGIGECSCFPYIECTRKERVNRYAHYA